MRQVVCIDSNWIGGVGSRQFKMTAAQWVEISSKEAPTRLRKLVAGLILFAGQRHFHADA